MQLLGTTGVGMLLGLLLFGCGAGGASGGKGAGPVFPSRADLGAIMARPQAKSQGQDRATLAVDDWQPEAASPASEAERVVKRAGDAKGRALAISPELGCAAREVARFHAKHKAFPDQQLQAHMAGVCGVTTPGFGVTVWMTPNDTIADAARLNQWHQGIAGQLTESLPAGMSHAGASQFSDDQNSVFAVTFANSAVTWEKVTTVADAEGKVELSGRVTRPAAFVYGLVNVGAYGVKDCQTDPRVAAPRFRVTCELDAADTSAWLGIQALAPGRVLAQTVGRVLLRREGTALGYSAPTKNLAPENVTHPVEFAKRVLSLVNETRAAARLPALRLAARESETSARLAPHYFQSEIGVHATADTIALGLLAGWDIKGPTIRNGDFYSSALSGSLDPRRWLSFMLEQPTARRVLLSPKATAIAIGPYLEPQTQSVAALINTYAFYESDDHRADVERFVKRLNQRRVALGLAPAKVSQAPEVARAVRAVKTSHDPAAALNDAMQQVVERVQRGVEGYYIEASDLDHVTLPDALLRPSVTIAVSAAHHRYPQAAWGTLTLLVVILESSGPQRTAHLQRLPG